MQNTARLAKKPRTRGSITKQRWFWVVVSDLLLFQPYAKNTRDIREKFVLFLSLRSCFSRSMKLCLCCSSKLWVVYDKVEYLYLFRFGWCVEKFIALFRQILVANSFLVTSEFMKWNMIIFSNEKKYEIFTAMLNFEIFFRIRKFRRNLNMCFFLKEIEFY